MWCCVHPKLASVYHTDADGGPIEIKQISEYEAIRRVAFALAKTEYGDFEAPVPARTHEADE